MINRTGSQIRSTPVRPGVYRKIMRRRKQVSKRKPLGPPLGASQVPAAPDLPLPTESPLYDWRSRRAGAETEDRREHLDQGGGI